MYPQYLTFALCLVHEAFGKGYAMPKQINNYTRRPTKKPVVHLRCAVPVHPVIILSTKLRTQRRRTVGPQVRVYAHLMSEEPRTLRDQGEARRSGRPLTPRLPPPSSFSSPYISTTMSTASSFASLEVNALDEGKGGGKPSRGRAAGNEPLCTNQACSLGPDPSLSMSSALPGV